MRQSDGSENRFGMTRRRSVANRVAAAGIMLATTASLLLAGQGTTQAVAAPPNDSGFAQPFSGTPRYLPLAPTEISDQRQINQPIGQHAADAVARRFGLRKQDALTPAQYRLLIAGKGVGGDAAAAKMIRQSIAILTNTVGRPLFFRHSGKWIPSVLASYGLFVNTDGLLESPANVDAPTRQINSLLVPGGYMGKWFRANGATRSLVRLYRSGYLAEAVFGNKSQQQSGVAQLVANDKLVTRGDLRPVRVKVGMPMAPSIWLVNFALIYTVNPQLAAKMPAAWAPIPPVVARAILASPTGQVPYLRYAAAFR